MRGGGERGTVGIVREACMSDGLSLLGLLLLQVLVGSEANQAADEDDGIQANAEAGAIRLSGRSEGTGQGRLGLRVAGL